MRDFGCTLCKLLSLPRSPCKILSRAESHQNCRDKCNCKICPHPQIFYLGVQPPSLSCVTRWGLSSNFRQFPGNFGNLPGPLSGIFRQFYAIPSNFRKFQAVLGNFRRFGGPKPRKKPVLINKNKAEDCTPNVIAQRLSNFCQTFEQQGPLRRN